MQETLTSFHSYKEIASAAFHKAEKLANRYAFRQGAGQIDIEVFIADYKKHELHKPRKDAEPIDETRFERFKLLAQKAIAHEYLPAQAQMEKLRTQLTALENQLSRPENYLYFTTIALRLIREVSIRDELVVAENSTKLFKSLSNAAAHPMNY